MPSLALNYSLCKNLIKEKNPVRQTSELEPYLRFNRSLKWGLTPDLFQLNIPPPARLLVWNTTFMFPSNFDCS